MEETKTESPKFFEDLTKEERKRLRKEFNKVVETRFKIFFWCGAVLFLCACAGGGISCYFLINILLTGVISFQLYICAAVFTVGCVAALLLVSRYHKRFHKWLKAHKNIVFKAELNSVNTINIHKM